MPETWLDQLIYMVILVLKILAIVVPLILAVAYYTYMERKVIGAMQIRKGPNRIGPLGLAQPRPPSWSTATTRRGSLSAWISLHRLASCSRSW